VLWGQWCAAAAVRYEARAIERTAADALLEDLELVPLLEGNALQARELERQLLASEIPVRLAAPPAKACCGGGCACSTKLQILVRSEDVAKVGELMHAEWLEAVRREGTLEQVALAPIAPLEEGADPPCPACGFVGPLQEGACADCGLQLE
jgi:hypothetical protein